MMVENLPAVNASGVYELSRYFEHNAKNFITGLENVVNSRLYTDAYTPQERNVINAALVLAKGGVQPSYPTPTRVDEDYSFTVTRPYGYDYRSGKKVTITTYPLLELRVTVGANQYSCRSGSAFDEFDNVNMMLNGGNRYVSALKTVTVMYDPEDNSNQTEVTTSLYEQSQDLYSSVPVYGSNARNILNTYNSLYSNYGQALWTIFQDASVTDSLSQKYLESKGLTTADINNYKKYLNAKADYDHYSPDYEMIPDNKVTAQRYEEIFNAIKSAGGWTEVSGANAKSASWVTNMVKSSQVILATWDAENSMLSKTADSLHYNLREIADQNAIEVASQQYEEELATINSKDSKFDTRLEKLETERETIEYEIKSLKDVAEQNVNTTFKVFT